jgi:uncharacterized cupin superfamily protein
LSKRRVAPQLQYPETKFSDNENKFEYIHMQNGARAATTQEMIASTTEVALGPAPITASWVREGNPQARNALLSRSADGTAFTVLWDCTAGKFEWTYSIDETIYFLEGAAIIDDGHSPPRRFVAGDVLFLPCGTVAHWHVEEYVRKIAFCRSTLPKVLELGFRASRKLKRMIAADRDRSGGGLLQTMVLHIGLIPTLMLDTIGLLEVLA